MKVKELIELLKGENQELEVETQGCDCNGDVVAVKETAGNYGKTVVLLERNPEEVH